MITCRDKFVKARDAGAVFSTEVLDEVDVRGLTLRELRPLEAEMFKAEARWIARFGPENLWNNTTGGGRGWILSEETRRKIGDSSRNRVISAETGAKISRAKRGRPFAGDRQKSSRAMKARWTDPEYRRRVVRGLLCSNTGRPKGWIITAEEAELFGVLPGRAILTQEQKKTLCKYRNVVSGVTLKSKVDFEAMRAAARMTLTVKTAAEVAA